MAGVKLTSDAKLKLKLLAGFYKSYYPNDAIARDAVIDWAISNFEPFDCSVVWSGKHYALQCRTCGVVAARPATMLRHLREGRGSTDSTLDIRARTGANEARNDALRVLAQPEGADESALDIGEGSTHVEEPSGQQPATYTPDSVGPARGKGSHDAYAPQVE